MKVRMVTLAAGPGGIWRPGDVVDLPTAEAVALLNGGQADPVKEAGGRVAVPLPLERETAVLPQGDKETRRQGDRETGRQEDRETGRQGDKERADWTLVSGISDELCGMLWREGFEAAIDVLDEVKLGGRSRLLDLPGIGPGRLKALRKFAEEAAGVGQGERELRIEN